MKNKILAAVLAAATVFGTISQAADIGIFYNGEKMELDAGAYIKNDRTMVPVRGIFEAVGANVTWDEETQTVMIAKADGDDVTFIFLQVGTDTAFVNSNQVQLDSPAEISSDRAMVPLRFIMENLGASVSWNAEERTVSIAKGE